MSEPTHVPRPSARAGLAVPAYGGHPAFKSRARKCVNGMQRLVALAQPAFGTERAR